jgi:hypothetical protein
MASSGDTAAVKWELLVERGDADTTEEEAHELRPYLRDLHARLCLLEKYVDWLMRGGHG